MKIDPTIFKQYDLRGVYGKNLTERESELIGKAFGTLIQQKEISTVAVGRDNRYHSVSLQTALIKGLLSTGCSVIDLGLTITPIVYFSWYHLKAPAAIEVSASHNPPEYNGYKVSMKRRNFTAKEIQKLYQIIAREEFIKGKRGKLRFRSINVDYVNYLIKNITFKRKLKIVLDCGNGTASILFPQLLLQLGCEVYPIHSISDGSFPNHLPYPQQVELYKDLRAKMKDIGADIGIAVDGDGDRLGVFDEKGNFIEGDVLTAIAARGLSKKYKRLNVVVNVSFSQSVIDDIEKRGGRVYTWKTGYPNITRKMKEVKAKLGGEISGHLFFADRYYGYDDAIYAACRIIEILSDSNKPLSEIYKYLPKYYTSSEYRVPAPEEEKFEIVKKIARRFKSNLQYEIIDVDGARVSTPDGWFLIRPSNTEPLITGRCEGKTRKRLKELQEFVKQILASYNVKLDWRSPIQTH